MYLAPHLSDQHEILLNEVRDAEAQLSTAIDAYNEAKDKLDANLRAAVASYNEVVKSVETFRDTVVSWAEDNIEEADDDDADDVENIMASEWGDLDCETFDPEYADAVELPVSLAESLEVLPLSDD